MGQKGPRFEENNSAEFLFPILRSSPFSDVSIIIIIMMETVLTVQQEVYTEVCKPEPCVVVLPTEPLPQTVQQGLSPLHGALLDGPTASSAASSSSASSTSFSVARKVSTSSDHHQQGLGETGQGKRKIS